MTGQIEKCEMGVVEEESKMDSVAARFLGKSIGHLFLDHRKVAVDAQEAYLPLSIEADPGYQSLELVSYAIPALSSLERKNIRDVTHLDFEKNLSLALGTFIRQLPPGDALVVEYHLAPSPRTGGMSISCILRTCHASASGSSGLSGELAVCLATLSDYYGFRVSNPSDGVIHPASKDDVFCIRPTSVECGSRSGAIGFTQSSKEPLTAIRLPVITSNLDEAVFSSGGLVNTIKAARAARCDLRLSIRITRESLDSSCKAALRGLLNHDIQSVDTNDDKPVVGATMMKLALAWSEVTDAFLVELEARGNGIPSSLLQIAGNEFFAGRQVEIVPKADAIQKSLGLNLTNIFPMDSGVPPLLPSPSILEAFAFPHHYSNPVVSLPESGLLLGHTLLGGFEQPVRMMAPDLARHTYMIGGSGAGKSTVIYNMFCQDMAAGNGGVLIDPHGDLFNQVLNSVPKHRLSDVVIIDPSDESSLCCLNPMDFMGKASPLKINRVINYLLDIFNNLYNMRESGGPGFENYFRNCFLLASTAPEIKPPEGLPKGSPTFLTAIEILRNKEYRDFLLKWCTQSHLGADLGGEVARFFTAAEATSGDQRFSNWVPYVSSKLTRFTQNPVLRKIICTPKRSIDFRQIIDERKILLVNLNKGFLGEQDSKMLGMLVTHSLFEAALSRSDIPLKARVPVACYIDEFQNIISNDTISCALSEVRKYGMSLVLAHQTLGQLREKESHAILDAILGNVGSKLFFRVGLRDAKELEPELKPHFDAATLTQLPDRHVLAKILVNNKPSAPFVFRTLPVIMPDIEMPAALNLEGRVANSAADSKAIKLASGELMVDGVLGIKFGPGQAVQAREFQTKIKRALKTWKNMPNLEPSIAPEKSCFYFTRNGSLVFCLSTDSDGDAKVLVLTKGHGQEGLLGKIPGGRYTVNRHGCFFTRYPSLSMLGMDLVKKADASFADASALGEPIDSKGKWLLQGHPKLSCVAVRHGFFRTFNNSIVYVSQDGAKKTPPEAVVCIGGHGIPEIPGTERDEKFTLSSSGYWLLTNYPQAENIPAQALALAGGLNLAEYLPLVGDVPAWLKSSKVVQKRQAAKRQGG